MLTTAQEYQGSATREMTDYEKARAWDRHVAFTEQLAANEQEIEIRKDRRYELMRQIDNNYKQAVLMAGGTVEQCPGCNYDICICEPVTR